jgi:acyl carrier protein
MQDQNKILETIAECLTLPVADLDAQAHIKDDLGLNPVEIADLISCLSEKFNIVFDKGEVSEIETITDLTNLVEDKMLE